MTPSGGNYDISISTKETEKSAFLLFDFHVTSILGLQERFTTERIDKETPGYDIVHGLVAFV